MNGLETLLRPRSVAVIGASEDIRTFSGAPIHNLLRHHFPGAVYAVNPGRSEVQGLPSFPSVLDIPGTVDTVVIAVPTLAVIPVLKECVQKGVSSATIITSGFGEEAAGPEGKVRAAELEALIRSSGIRVLGPNTAGLANLNASYVPRGAHNQLDPDKVKPGAVALITQSGACGNIVYNRAQANGVGIGLSVATGDQIDIDVWELCQSAIEDPSFRVAIVVAETLGDVSRLEKVAASASAAGKLVVILKLGRSEIGRQAVMTHSGSLAGDAAVQSAALRQLGLVEVDDLDDLWRVAGLVEAWGTPDAKAGRLGVVALSGGEGALIADVCGVHGIELPPTSPAFADFIKSNFAYAMAANPFDPSGEIIGRPEKVKLALRAFMDQNDFSEVLVATPVLRGEQADRQLGEVGDILQAPRPNLCFSYWSAGELTDRQEQILRATQQPVFEGSGAAVRAMATYRRAGLRRRGVRLPAERGAARGGLQADATYFSVRRELAQTGIAFAEAQLARSLQDAATLATGIGFPVVMKANVPSSVHKFANRLIQLDVRTAAAASAAFESLSTAAKAFHGDGVVVEAAGKGQVEVMIGAYRDPDFGETLLFGGGGTMVEYMSDAALGIARYTDGDEAIGMVRATRAGRFLHDRAPSTVGALAGYLKVVTEWFYANSQIAELDLNPLMVDLATGAITCVDARVA
jgi:acetate---CoA ligase (ADP-forming)